MILTVRTGDSLSIYLVDKKGRLERAAMRQTNASLAHGSITMVKLALAAPGFEIEKKFWFREVALNSADEPGSER
jgi:hypothetical protein